MEIKTNQQMVAKKVWKTLRIILFMLTKGIAKSKMVEELNLFLKRGKIAAVKAISNTLRHHAAVSSFVAPHDYEFSCNNSPAGVKFYNKNKYQCHHHHHDVSTVKKVLEILNDMDASSFSSSPLVALPGFGKSPIGKKLIRITDSPFPLKEDEEDVDHSHVDIAAEEFIKRFYRNLNLQQKLATMESPYNNSRCRQSNLKC